MPRRPNPSSPSGTAAQTDRSGKAGPRLCRPAPQSSYRPPSRSRPSLVRAPGMAYGRTSRSLMSGRRYRCLSGLPSRPAAGPLRKQTPLGDPAQETAGMTNNPCAVWATLPNWTVSARHAANASPALGCPTSRGTALSRRLRGAVLMRYLQLSGPSAFLGTPPTPWPCGRPAEHGGVTSKTAAHGRASA